MLRPLQNLGRALLKHGRIFWLVAGMLLLLLLKGLLGLFSLAGHAPANPGAAAGGALAMGLPVEVAAVSQGNLEDTVNVAGSLRADRGITLRPEVAGVVRALPFKEGEKVNSGTVLVQLDDAITKASLAQAKAQYRLVQRNLARLKTLRDEDEALVSKRDFDSALSDLDVADAAVKTAQAQLDKTHIAAPFAGTVGLQKVSLGEYVTVGQDLVTLQALDPLKVEFSLPESYGPALQPGMPIDVRIDALNGQVISATILAIDPTITSGGRNVNVTAQIPNPTGDLRPGMFARVTTTFGQADNALQVPEEAIVPEGDAKFVYRVVNGKAVKTPVTLGIRSAGSVQITSGLNAHDLVVSAGMLKIGDGSPVTPMNLSVQNTSAPQPPATQTATTAPADATPDVTQTAPAAGPASATTPAPAPATTNPTRNN